MKTPEEIKKGLECCDAVWCEGRKCPYFEIENRCFELLMKDALALIQQLEADLKQEKADHQHTYECAEAFQKENAELLEKVKQLERERDAAVRDLESARNCRNCKYEKLDPANLPCRECGISMRNYEWRGPCEENTENP